MSGQKDKLVSKGKQFEYECVNIWNPGLVKRIKIVVPEVSLCNEIKTSRSVMTIIELLCLSSIILQETSEKRAKQWFLL